MAAVNRGFGGCIGIGVESTYGTSVARTNWKYVYSAGLRRTRTKTPIGHLGDLSQASTMGRSFVLESDFAGGPISMPIAYDDSSVLLSRHVFGTNADTGAGPFTHTETLSSPLPGPLTIEQINGTPASGGGNMAEVFVSCLINGSTWTFEAGKLATLDLDVIAQTSGGLVAPGTPSHNLTREYVQHQHLSTFTLGGTTMQAKKLTITTSRGLQRNQELGSLLTQIPVEDRLSVEIEVVALWQKQAWYDNYLADTQGALSVVFTGTSSRSLTIAAQNVLVVDRSAPVQTAAGIQETIKLRPHADASNQGLSFAWVNSNALHTAN